MSTVTFTLRAPTNEDIPALVALEHVWDQMVGSWRVTTADDLMQIWQQPGFDRDRMAIVAETGDRIVGEFVLDPPEVGKMRSRGFVHPDARGRGIGTALMRAGIGVAREMGVETLFTHSEEEVSFELFKAHGFTYARTFIKMVNTDPKNAGPVDWPDGTRPVPLQGTALVEAVVEALNGSFVDHWNFTPAEAEKVAHELEDPAEDPALWLVALGENDAVAGCCICHLQAGDVVRGHLGPIGTTRAYRGIGLGRAMLRHGVRQLADLGAVAVTLGVDMENPNGALGLYERNGFRREGALRVFELSL
jgi:mycothiol synthase